MHLYMHAMCVVGAQEGQRRASHFLKLESWMVVNHRIGAKNWTQANSVLFVFCFLFSVLLSINVCFSFHLLTLDFIASFLVLEVIEYLRICQLLSKVAVPFWSATDKRTIPFCSAISPKAGIYSPFVCCNVQCVGDIVMALASIFPWNNEAEHISGHVQLFLYEQLCAFCFYLWLFVHDWALMFFHTQEMMIHHVFSFP